MPKSALWLEVTAHYMHSFHLDSSVKMKWNAGIETALRICIKPQRQSGFPDWHQLIVIARDLACVRCLPATHSLQLHSLCYANIVSFRHRSVSKKKHSSPTCTAGMGKTALVSHLAWMAGRSVLTRRTWQTPPKAAQRVNRNQKPAGGHTH